MSDWVSQPLTADHDVGAFRCGEPPLDRWLCEFGLRAQATGTAHTTAWTAAGETRVVAYYAITPTQVTRAELPSRSFSGGVSVVPGYLVARLALDASLQRRGLGSELLHDALSSA